MNIILLTRTDCWRADDCVILRDRRADHIRGVLRARVGDVLRVGLIDGLSGQAVVSALDSEAVTLRVALADPPPKRHRFDIVLALPRPKMLRRILRTVAEFGVSNLHLINTARVDKSFLADPVASTAPGAGGASGRDGTLEGHRCTQGASASVVPAFRGGPAGGDLCRSTLLDRSDGRTPGPARHPCWTGAGDDRTGRGFRSV